MSKPHLRADAASVIFAVLEHGQSLRESLPAIQEMHKEQDRAWLQEMVYGVMRQLPLLQFWLRQLLDKPLKGRSKIIESLILLGFYQLAFSRVSEHAAVSETVGACQALKAPGMKGLVNAVLRNFIRRKQAEARPDDAQILAGLPKWLFKRLQQDYPEPFDNLVVQMQDKAPMWLRVNTQVNSREQFLQQLTLPYSLSDEHPDAIILDKACDVTTLPGYQQGAFAVQDGAAQLAAYMLAPEKGERILDACAAPGGKTCHLLEVQPQLAECQALDVDKIRLQRVTDNLQRLGHSAQLLCGDASKPEQWWDGKPYDRILLDAPCSATGVIRRHPDIKWLRKAKDIEALVELQAQILDNMWQLLKPGGTLLYATCSILPAENREQIKAFLQRTADATLSPVVKGDNNDNPGRQILPGEQKMDGFYYARLIKSV